MLNEEEFTLKATLLGSTLSGLWLYMYRARTAGLTDEGYETFKRILSEVNRLHREMFPDFEHDLYSDDLISWLEEERPLWQE